jgi:hypothetical protein
MADVVNNAPRFTFSKIEEKNQEEEGCERDYGKDISNKCRRFKTTSQTEDQTEDARVLARERRGKPDSQNATR